MKKQKVIDMTGKKIGMLTVICRAPDHVTKGGYKQTMWLCKCDCGSEKDVIVSYPNLKSGKTLSCGCIRRQMMSEIGKSRKTHGARSIDADKNDKRLYRIWTGIKQRIFNENCFAYKNYGERGIKMSDEWRNSFDSFREWAYKNGYESHLSIDRIDVNGDYVPENCRWVTAKEQANNRRNNNIITSDNESHTISEWSRIKNMCRSTIHKRICKHNYSNTDALNKETIRTINFNGKELSTTDWSKISGIPKHIIRNRLRRGWDTESAIFKPIYEAPKIMINGIERTTLEWSRISGVSNSTIRSRLKRGWDPENAVFKVCSNHKKESNVSDSEDD